MNDLGIYASDQEFMMREFSKSFYFTNRAYSWFVNLPVGSICTWEELVATFCTKFIILEHKLSLSNLSSEKKEENESLTVYVNTFKENVLDCKEIISEIELIQLCIKGICDEYKIHIENHIVPNFVELMIKVKNTKKLVASIQKAMPYKAWNKSTFFKRKIEVDVVEKGKRHQSTPPKIPLPRNATLSLVKAWMEDGLLWNPMVKTPPTP